MQKNDLISIILPIYKVENYLDRCVNSIVNQTYKNLEIILVDDGSPDKCPQKCDQWAKKDARIKVIHKANGGLSSARNAGIEVASGDYLMFVDSDDYVSKFYVEGLYTALCETQSDMCFCGFLPFENDIEIKDIKSIDNLNISVFENNDIFNLLIDSKHKLNVVVAWNKIYKKELFESIRYPVGKIHEDEFIVHQLLDKCKKVGYVERELYYYFQRDDSIMKKPFNVNRLDICPAFENRIAFFKDKNNEIYIATIKKYLNKLISYFCEKKINNKKVVNKIIKYKFKTALHKYKKDVKLLPFKTRIKYCLFKMFPKLLKLIKK